MKKINKIYYINIGITLLLAMLLYYLVLPPLNWHSPDFWTFVLFIYLIYIGLNFLSFVKCAFKLGDIKTIKVSKNFKIMLLVIPGFVVLFLIINFILSPLFNSSSYSSRIIINQDKDFATEVKEVDFDHVPLLDRDSTLKIGDRVMGEMTDLVSQFNVSDIYTQINYNNNIVRVTPLEYDGIIKYFTNRGKGITGYIVVNSVTGEADLVRLEKGMKYMPSAMFNEKLERKLRFSYPTEIFGEANFELDNEGKPYWVVPTITYSGIGLKEEITGVVVLDPVTGSSKKYDVDEVPNWIDHVYSADLILEQVNDWGKYNGGFFNSIFGQKNVVATTTGYNYMVQDDDVFLYTGITSVASDESNLGFILTNMRTKETNYYLIPGAEEYSAMASAEGQVQQMKFTSTFPLLINLNGKATYLVSLKDNSGLVKMYGFVDVQNYQKVIVTDANEGIIAAKDNYLKNVGNALSKDILEDSIVIQSINTAIINGNTYYYIEATNGRKYKASIKVNEDILPFAKVGTTLNVTYHESPLVIDINSIK